MKMKLRILTTFIAALAVTASAFGASALEPLGGVRSEARATVTPTKTTAKSPSSKKSKKQKRQKSVCKAAKKAKKKAAKLCVQGKKKHKKGKSKKHGGRR
jgi:Skp family chaperone for outer membrane proteins